MANVLDETNKRMSRKDSFVSDHSVKSALSARSGYNASSVVKHDERRMLDVSGPQLLTSALRNINVSNQHHTSKGVGVKFKLEPKDFLTLD